MDAKQFFSKVCAMRKAQRAYYNSRSHTELKKAMALEKEIDIEIARVARLTHQPDIMSEPQQQTINWEEMP